MNALFSFSEKMHTREEQARECFKNKNYFENAWNIVDIKNGDTIYILYEQHIITKATFLEGSKQEEGQYRFTLKNIEDVNSDKVDFTKIPSGGCLTYLKSEEQQQEIDRVIYDIDTIEEDGKNLPENAIRRITVNKYERNSEARNKCIEYYKRQSQDNKIKCLVCKFDFEKTFGEIGKNFIHIHHIVPLSKLSEIEKKEYRINPIKDLIPLCPNCHHMIHKNNNSTAEELKTLLKKVRTKNAK